MGNNKKYDVLIVGAGIGGLTAGALLARKGLEVLLLEKEKQAGGYVVSFKRGDYTFDATGAFIGGCEEGGEFDQILKEMDAREAIEFIPVQTIHNIYPGFQIRLETGGFSSYADGLLHLFPEEEKGLKDYLSLVKRIGDEVNSYSRITPTRKILFPLFFRNVIRFHRTTHQNMLDRLFKGREIKMALHTLPVTDPPSRLSFLLVATLISKALREGVFYPRGGMGKISEAMAHSFLRAGGEILLRTEVDQVLIKDGRVEGVLTKDGRVFQSPLIISNINPRLLSELIPQESRYPVARKMRRFEYSLSCFILYLATDLNLRERGFPYFTYLRSLSDLEEEYHMMQRGEIPKNPTLIVSVPTLLDPSLAPEGKHIVKVLVVAPYHYQERWGAGDSETYHRIKEEFSQKILQQLESKLIPGLKDHLLFSEAATPLTLEQYTGNEQGAMYGLASTPAQVGNFRPSHQTPVPGLFQVGHYTRPSHGVVGASLSGLFAARSILRNMQKP
jgi:prolycopene isomerase